MGLVVWKRKYAVDGAAEIVKGNESKLYSLISNHVH